MADALHDLIFGCRQSFHGAQTIAEDLAGLQSLHQRLLRITQAGNLTMTQKVGVSNHSATWKRFRARNPHRKEDIECLEEYLRTAKIANDKKYSCSKLWTISTVKAAQSRIVKDQRDLLIMLASIDPTRPLSKRDRTVVDLEQKVADLTEAIKQTWAQMTKRQQERDELVEESRLWDVAGHEEQAIFSTYSSDMQALRFKVLELFEQKQQMLRELRKLKDGIAKTIALKTLDIMMGSIATIHYHLSAPARQRAVVR